MTMKYYVVGEAVLLLVSAGVTHIAIFISEVSWVSESKMGSLI